MLTFHTIAEFLDDSHKALILVNIQDYVFQ